jgi:hypothetical protein
MGRDLAEITTTTITPNHAGRLPHPNVPGNKDDKRLSTNLIEPNGYHGEKVAPIQCRCAVGGQNKLSRSQQMLDQERCAYADQPNLRFR